MAELNALREAGHAENHALDAARAEGGASADHIPDAGKMVGGDVEELVERLRAQREAETWYTGGYRPLELVNPDGPEAADTLLSLSRLLQERTRERDEARGEYAIERVHSAGGYEAGARWKSRAETAERALEEARRRLFASGDLFGANEVTVALEKMRGRS